jgi:hypothetical protein
MKHSDYNKLIELKNMGNGWIPANENAQELTEQSRRGEVVTFAEVTARDLKFHKAYMSLLGFIYDCLPNKFKEAIPKEKFYIFVKHLKKNYQVLFTFKDGTSLVEYESIAFGNMSQKRFETYVREQLPFIYENVIGEFYKGDIYNNIVATIEEEFKNFLAKIN